MSYYEIKTVQEPEPTGCSVIVDQSGNIARSDQKIDDLHRCDKEPVSLTVRVEDHDVMNYCKDHLIVGVHHLAMCAFQSDKYRFKSYKIDKAGYSGHAKFTIEVQEK